MTENNKKKSESLNVKELSLGINMAVGIAVFTGIGYGIDKKFDLNFCTLIGIFLGLIYSAYEVWLLVKD